jgi:hypothetical protein
MNAGWFLDNLIAWSAQVCVLAAVAAGAALALTHPRARLVFWHAVLAIALLLPVVQPWIPPGGPDGDVAISTGPGVVVGGASAHSGIVFRREYVLILIAAGIVVRLLWIGIGFLRLRRHRLAARALLHPPVPFEGSHVRWYVSDSVSGPVTFGWLRPSILLPSRVNHLAIELREAIACHELVHVQRRDWLFVLAEELIRAILWFHPAVWLMLSQIQLAREQTVDLEVVRLTRDRERYLDALVAVAEQKLCPDVAPAPLFLKKRQLAVRVAAVLKETTMPKPRLFARFATVFSAALVAARLAVWFFPMQSPAQSTSGTLFGDDPAMTVDAGAPLMHRAPIFRPSGATSGGIVVVDASVDSKGEVTDARVVSGPDELRKPVLQSVLQWHYSTDTALPPSIRITVKFDPAPAASKLAPPPAPAAGIPTTLKTIEFVGVPQEVQQKVRDILPVREGDQISASSVRRILEAVSLVDEHFVAHINTNAAHESTLTLALGNPPPNYGMPPAAALALEEANRTGAAVNQTPQRIRVGGNVQAMNLVQKVTPPLSTARQRGSHSGSGQIRGDHRKGRQHYRSATTFRTSAPGTRGDRGGKAMGL